MSDNTWTPKTKYVPVTLEQAAYVVAFNQEAILGLIEESETLADPGVKAMITLLLNLGGALTLANVQMSQDVGSFLIGQEIAKMDEPKE